MNLKRARVDEGDRLQQRPRVIDCTLEGGGPLQQLPQDVIQHILSYLGGRDAVRVGVVSKTLYSAWSLLPILRLDFNTGGDGMNYFIMNYTNKSLERYRRHNACIQQLHLTINHRPSNVDQLSLVGGLLRNFEEAGAREIYLSFINPSHTYDYIENLIQVLECKPLVELNAQDCQLKQPTGGIGSVRCALLRRLKLRNVLVDAATLENIFSNCPLIQSLQLDFCSGLTRTKGLSLQNLKELAITGYIYQSDVEVEAPNLESFFASIVCFIPSTLRRCSNLKKLSLDLATIKEDCFENLDDKFPCLEYLRCWGLMGFERLKIASKSLRFLKIKLTKPATLEIAAPNLVSTTYKGAECPIFESLETSTSPSKCYIALYPSSWHPAWFLRLKKMLKKLVNSCVKIFIRDRTNNIDRLTCIPHNLSDPGVKLDYLELSIPRLSASSEVVYSNLLDNLFWSCRPECLGIGLYSTNRGFINFLCERLIDLEVNPNKYTCFWENNINRGRIALYNNSQPGSHPVANVDCKTFIGTSSLGLMDSKLIYFIFD